jgi:pyruvate, orthophosphate dikinase
MKPQEIIRDRGDGVVSLDAGSAVREAAFGRRAWKLARLTSLGLPVPSGFALSFECVRGLSADGTMPDLPGIDAPGRLLALRSSPREREWGGAPTLRCIGVGERSLQALETRFGRAAALDIYRRFIGEFAMTVYGLDPDDFNALDPEAARGSDSAALRGLIDEMLVLYDAEIGEPFPQDPRIQLEQAARAMAKTWNAPSARILREAKGAPADAGLGLIVQEVASGIGSGVTGRGEIQFVDSRTGKAAFNGYFRLIDPEKPSRVRELPIVANSDIGDVPGGDTLEDLCPDVLRELRRAAMRAAEGMSDVYRLMFAVRSGKLAVLDACPVRRTARAAVQISVDLAKKGAISRSRALLQVDPRSLVEYLHPQIAPNAHRDVFGIGLAASPGAATGRIVFTAESAQAAAAQDEASILVRVETGPEDIRGMHSAHGVLTVRGGMTSHAAVIARGIGLPCVVGASDLRLDFAERTLTTSDGRIIREGALVTLDGTRGEAMVGSVEMIAPELDGSFSELLDWADAVRDLGVRANADTPADARTAREFRVDGIGLCRTEHMFFDTARISVMREMILADSAKERQTALDRLLPMQRDDFREIFEIMRGLPVTIRLLDPPLHEFLPNAPEEIAEFAEAMGLPVAQVTARARELSEVNPMLGMRGVRLGITMPEIYEMQARAIFEAAIEVNRDSRAPVAPEVMIPLVSANREVELVKRRVDAIAEDVQREQGATLDYKLGVMVETPRAALRAGDLAATAAFLSFGTNDLTQMTYGLSRDDAGRFMRAYVNQGVFPEDPFHTLDVEGVGELMLIASQRGRAKNPGLTLGLCGEHGGDPSSVRFCKIAGFDYVSCSPFRVPIARLAAAQATLLSRSASAAGLGTGETK